MRDYPYPMADGTRSIALGIIFSLLTFGIYSLVLAVQTDGNAQRMVRANRLSFWTLVTPLHPNVWYLCPLLRIQDGDRNQLNSGEQRFASKQWLSGDLCFARDFWYWHRISCNPAMGNQQIL